jgi:hypothetical protein
MKYMRLERSIQLCSTVEKNEQPITTASGLWVTEQEEYHAFHDGFSSFYHGMHEITSAL